MSLLQPQQIYLGRHKSRDDSLPSPPLPHAKQNKRMLPTSHHCMLPACLIGKVLRRPYCKTSFSFKQGGRLQVAKLWVDFHYSDKVVGTSRGGIVHVEQLVPVLKRSLPAEAPRDSVKMHAINCLNLLDWACLGKMHSKRYLPKSGPPTNVDEQLAFSNLLHLFGASEALGLSAYKECYCKISASAEKPFKKKWRGHASRRKAISCSICSQRPAHRVDMEWVKCCAART